MKKLKLLFVSLCGVFLAVSSVHAQEVGGPNAKELKKCLESNEEVCTLTEDITASGDIDIVRDGNVTIDLNNHTLTLKKLAEIFVTLGNVTIKNGTLIQQSDGSAAIDVYDQASLRTENLTINVTGNVDGEDVPHAFLVNGIGAKQKGTLYVSEDTVINVDNGYGLLVSGGSEITLNGTWNTGKSIVVDDNGATKSSNITFNSGSYTAKDGAAVPITRGNWIFNGGTFISNTDDAILVHKPVNEKNVEKADALSVEINDGVFETKANGKKAINAITLKNFVSGGKFIANKVEDELPEEYISNGYESFVTENGETIVGKRYNITVEIPQNGKFTVDKESAIVGQEIILTVTPENNYEMDKIVVTDKNGKEIEVKDYRFTMPENDVTVKVIFKEKLADYSILDELIKESEKIDKTEYTEESYQKLEDAMNEAKALSRILKIHDQETVDNMVNKLENAIATLEKITITNPQTGDHILMYVGMSILSMGTVLFGTKKLKRS